MYLKFYKWGEIVIIGTDLGYSFTKDSNGNMFRSLMAKEKPAVTSAMEVNIDGKNYYVGTGSGTVNVNKTNSELTKVLLLTDLWLNKGTDYKIVTGLPIGQFNKQKEQLKQSILSWNHSRVSGKQIIISDVLIFPQAAGALYSQNIHDDCIVVDVGGRTTDIGLFEYPNGKATLINSSTVFKGMEGVSSEVVKAVNEKFELSLEPRHGEHILRKGLSVDGETKDVSFICGIASNYFEPVWTELKLNYPIRTTNVFYCGGGAKILSQQLKIKNSLVLSNSQFANALGFYRVGLSAFGGGNRYERSIG